MPAPLRPPQLLLHAPLRLAHEIAPLTEPLRHTRPPAGDESIAAFMRRKFGEDLLANLVAPFVSGVYAGDPEKLSLASAFPSVRQAEEQYGSVIRGANQDAPQRRRPRAAPRLCAIFARPRHADRSARGPARNRPPSAVPKSPLSAAVQPARIERASKSPTAPAARAHSLEASAIVLATPTREAARLLAPIEAAISRSLSPESSTPASCKSAQATASTKSPARASQPLRGFGFLVPRTEGLRLLGTVWNSSLFPNRAPEGMASFTSFLGGATDPEIYAWSDDRIAETVHKELAEVLGITGPPVAQHVARWERAIPQYNLGHGQNCRHARQTLRRHARRLPRRQLSIRPLAPRLHRASRKIAQNVIRFCSG